MIVVKNVMWFESLILIKVLKGLEDKVFFEESRSKNIN